MKKGTQFHLYVLDHEIMDAMLFTGTTTRSMDIKQSIRVQMKPTTSVDYAVLIGKNLAVDRFKE